MIHEFSPQRGFTLVEAMVTVSMTVILAATVSIGWQALIDRTTAYRVQSTLAQSFADARSQAITDREITTLCPLDDQLDCSSNWDRPISVFVDPQNERALTGNAELVQKHSAVNAGSFRASYSGPAERRYFQYNPDGSARGTLGHIVWCPNSGEADRAIQLRMNFGGRITWARDSDNDGVREDANNQPLTCP